MCCCCLHNGIQLYSQDEINSTCYIQMKFTFLLHTHTLLSFANCHIWVIMDLRVKRAWKLALSWDNHTVVSNELLTFLSCAVIHFLNQSILSGCRGAVIVTNTNE